MAVKVPEGWYDISVPLKQGMNYFPTDPAPPKIYRFHDRELGARVTMSMLEIISHTGTHIDSPLHFVPDGSTISDMPLDATIGPCRVIEIKDQEKIKVAELEKHDIKKIYEIDVKELNDKEKVKDMFNKFGITFRDLSLDVERNKNVRPTNLTKKDMMEAKGFIDAHSDEIFDRIGDKYSLKESLLDKLPKNNKSCMYLIYAAFLYFLTSIILVN